MERMSQYTFLCILIYLLALLYFIYVLTLAVIVQRARKYMRTFFCLIQNGDEDAYLLLHLLISRFLEWEFLCHVISVECCQLSILIGS